MSLLKEQLIQYFGHINNVPEEFGCFLKAVNKVYIKSDFEKKMLENNLAQKSQELSKVSQELFMLGRMLPDIFMRLDQEGKILEINARKMFYYYSSASPFLGKNILQVPIGRLNKKFQQAFYELSAARNFITLDIIMEPHKSDFYEACLLLLSSRQKILFIKNKREILASLNNNTWHNPSALSFIRENNLDVENINSESKYFNIEEAEIHKNFSSGRSPFGNMELLFPYYSGCFFTGKNQVDQGRRIYSNNGLEGQADTVNQILPGSNFYKNTNCQPHLQAPQNDLKNIAAPARAEKIKRLFLAKISHEIRTPLNAILGFTQLIAMRIAPLLGKEENDFMQIIKYSSKRLLRTIHELLDMSELETGTYLKKIEYMDLCNLLNELNAEFKSAAEEKKLIIIFNKNIKSAPIYGDKNGILLALRNIIDNAVKYTEQGSIAIDLEHVCGQYLLSIIDTGMGISNLYMEKIFGLFTQESEGYTRKFQGLGLGLSLAKVHLELNSVGLKVESKKGVGTKFLLSFEVCSREETRIDKSSADRKF